MESLFRYCHLLYAADLLHVDKGSENWFCVLVICVRTSLLLHGELMKWCIAGVIFTFYYLTWSHVCMQVSSWGGYVFLINLIPLHVLVLMLTGRFSHRIYVAYCTVYCLGTILSMQISFVGFQVRNSSTNVCKSKFFKIFYKLYFIIEFAEQRVFSTSSSLSFYPARAVLGAHGSLWRVWIMPDSRFCGLPAQQT